jgi:transcriptional regulator with XRE-family HTH domain
MLPLEVSITSAMTTEQEGASVAPEDWQQRLLAARKRAGLTQQTLADQIGMSQRTVNSYEHGRKPNITMYRKIAEACGVSETWLILGEGTAERQKVAGADESVGRDPDREQRVIQPFSETDQESPLFAWAIKYVSNVFLEEGIRADHRHLLIYTKNLLRLVQDTPDQAHAKNLILGAVERDRAEFRRQLNLLVDKITTSPRPP